MALYVIAMASRFPKLLEPMQLGHTTLINRVIMGSMHTGLEEGSGWNRSLTKMAGFFRERAKGHVGLMVTGGIAPNNAGMLMVNSLYYILDQYEPDLYDNDLTPTGPFRPCCTVCRDDDHC